MIYFQWINGPKIGNVVKYKHTEIEDGVLYVVFDDGTRCNREYVSLLNNISVDGKMVAHISGLDNKWVAYYEDIPAIQERYEMDSHGIQHCVQPYVPGKKIKRLTPPKFYHVSEIMTFDSEDKPPIVLPVDEIKPSETSTNNDYKSESFISHNTPTHTNNTIENNPVYILCEKCKKQPYEFDVNMEINLPPISLYEIATENFENGEEFFIDYVMGNLDMDTIKRQFREAIIQIYKSSL